MVPLLLGILCFTASAWNCSELYVLVFYLFFCTLLVNNFNIFT